MKPQFVSGKLIEALAAICEHDIPAIQAANDLAEKKRAITADGKKLLAMKLKYQKPSQT